MHVVSESAKTNHRFLNSAWRGLPRLFGKDCLLQATSDCWRWPYRNRRFARRCATAYGPGDQISASATPNDPLAATLARVPPNSRTDEYKGGPLQDDSDCGPTSLREFE